MHQGQGHRVLDVRRRRCDAGGSRREAERSCSQRVALPLERTVTEYLHVAEIEPYIQACADCSAGLAEFLIGPEARLSEAVTIPSPDVDLHAAVRGLRQLRDDARPDLTRMPSLSDRIPPARRRRLRARICCDPPPRRVIRIVPSAGTTRSFRYISRSPHGLRVWRGWWKPGRSGREPGGRSRRSTGSGA